jgi:hypothetical protein
MDTWTLRPSRVFPYPRLAVTTTVPDALRARLYSFELRVVWRLFEQYAEQHPRLASALLDPALFGTLARLLDEQVAPTVVELVRGEAAIRFPGAGITRDMYRQLATTLVANPEAFLDQHDSVRRRIHSTALNFQRSILRCCARLEEDWADLQAYFFAGVVQVALVRLGSSGSDFHKGGGQVLLLTFRDAAGNESCLVYKPSDLERDFRIVGDTAALTAALNAALLNVVTGKGVTAAVLLQGNGSLCELFNDQQQAAAATGPALPVYRILPVWPGSALALQTDAAGASVLPLRDSYGYTQFLTSGEQDNRFTAAQRQIYYSAFGAQVALCWLLQITDMHQENLIVHQHLPYLIDLEACSPGVLEVPSGTQLDTAYSTFCAEQQDRQVIGWDTPDLRYETPGTAARQPLLNALYDLDGHLAYPTNVDRAQLSAAFQSAVTLILANVAAYQTWLTNAAQLVARVLVISTRSLQGAERAMADAGNVADIVLMCQRGGDIDLSRWSPLFADAISPAQGDPPTPQQIGARYAALQPAFAVWSDPQLAADFADGDVPTFYQRMSGVDLLNSRGRALTVDYGRMLASLPAPRQLPVATALVQQWGAQAPLQPTWWFVQPVLQTQRQYLQQMQAPGGFSTLRIQAALQDLQRWPNRPDSQPG